MLCWFPDGMKLMSSWNVATGLGHFDCATLTPLFLIFFFLQSSFQAGWYLCYLNFFFPPYRWKFAHMTFILPCPPIIILNTGFYWGVFALEGRLRFFPPLRSRHVTQLSGRLEWVSDGQKEGGMTAGWGFICSFLPLCL